MQRNFPLIKRGLFLLLGLVVLAWLSAPRQDSGPEESNEPTPEDRELPFYQTLDTAPAPVLSPEQALDSFFIAPGFLLELVAAEPLIGDPVAMAWDEYGRLYVVEMRGFMPDAQGAGRFEPVGRVVRLEDTDADGRMDTSEESTTPAPGLGVVLTAPEEVFSVRVNPGVNRAYLEGVLRPDGRLRQATSASGLVVYRGRQFPRQYHENVFVAEPAANIVARFSIAENGLELRAEHHLYPDEKWGQREFLASTDERFRPVDLLNRPDGNLYIIDMYRGLIQDQQFLTGELREQVLQRQLEVPIGLGRIWRLRYAAGADDTATGGVANSNPAGGLAEAGAEHLVSLLRSENGWHRDTAQRLLLRIPGQGSAQLRSLVGGTHSLAAIHALWTLHGRGELERETVLAALALDDTRRQVQALRAGRAVLKMQDLLTLADTAQSAGEAVRMQLAFAMGDLPGITGVSQGPTG